MATNTLKFRFIVEVEFTPEEMQPSDMSDIEDGMRDYARRMQEDADEALGDVGDVVGASPIIRTIVEKVEATQL